MREKQRRDNSEAKEVVRPKNKRKKRKEGKSKERRGTKVCDYCGWMSKTKLVEISLHAIFGAWQARVKLLECSSSNPGPAGKRRGSICSRLQVVSIPTT